MSIPFFEIFAKDNYEFGHKLGVLTKDEIVTQLNYCKKLYPKEGSEFEHLKKNAKKFLPNLKRIYPQFLKELQGMADASNVDFYDLLAINCEYELLNFGECTSMGARLNNGDLVLGHNEDWIKGYNTFIFCIKGKVGKGPKFLCTAYPGELIGANGLNSNGLGFTGDALFIKKFRYGVPLVFIQRALLEASNPKEVEKIERLPEKSTSDEVLFCYKNELIEDIESFWTKRIIRKSDTLIVHTNHAVELTDKIKKDEDNSVARYKRALEMLSNKKELTIDSLKKVLSDHEALICAHIKDKREIFTLNSVIINPSKGWMEIAKGNPCNTPYVRYYL